MKRPAKTKRINVGIIGTGWPGQQHARMMSIIPEAHLYACADLDETRRREFEAVYAPEKSFHDYQELLQDPKLDAVMICLPTSLLRRATIPLHAGAIEATYAL